MRDFKELDGCYILNIMFAIGKVDKIPLSDFYKNGYWISEIFGDRCYLVKKHSSRGSLYFTSAMRFCEITPNGQKFIENYAKKKAKQYEKYLLGFGYQKPWEYLR